MGKEKNIRNHFYPGIKDLKQEILVPYLQLQQKNH